MKRKLELESSGQSKKQNDQQTRNRELATVLVSNLPKSYNQTKIRKYFQECGRIAQIDVCDSISKEYRLARVEFMGYHEALSALTKTFKKIGNNEITVTLLENSTLWMTNFPPRFTQHDIKDLFLSIDVVALSVRLPSLRFNANRRFAYVDVSSHEEADLAIQNLDGKEIDDHRLIIKASDPLKKSKRTDCGALERREVLVRHLDLTKVTRDSLHALFSKFGPIESVKIPGTQGSRLDDGYGFVVFEEKTAAKQASEAKDLKLEDKEISVSISDRKAYLERQEVKKILNAKHKSDLIISLFPLSDKCSKVQIEKLLHDQACLNENDIKKIYLVGDHEGALVVLKESKLAAKSAMSLNGVEFQNKNVRCGTVKDLRKHNKKMETIEPKKISFCNVDPSEEGKEERPKLSNDDFRKLFLGK